VVDTDALPAPNKPCKDFHYVTKGYRRVAGDTCLNGGRWDRIQVPCGSLVGATHIGKVMLLLLVVIVVALAVATFYGKIECLEDLVDWAKSKFTSSGYSVVGKKAPHSMADDDFGIDDQVRVLHGQRYGCDYLC